SRAGRTDERGVARFENLWAGATVVVADRGEVARTELSPGATQTVALELPGDGTVDGTVVAWSGAPGGEAQIQLSVAVDVSGLDAAFSTIATSDRGGAFRARGLHPGQQIVARKTGHAPSAVTTVRAAPEELRLVLPARGAALRARVRSA